MSASKNTRNPRITSNLAVQYLPECWESDDRMSSLMSMFKRRDVNPAEYDAKMRFWSDLIVSSSSALCNPVFTLKQLSSRFQRNDRVPAGLETVIRDMISRGIASPASEYSKSLGQQGWIGWGVDLFVKRPLSWVWSGSGASDKDVGSMEFVIPCVVEEIATEIVKRRKEALDGADAEDDPLAQDVVAYSTLRRSFRNDVDQQWRSIDDRALELALNYLQHQHQAVVEMSASGNRSEKLIKFKSAHEAEPPRMTETDRQILEVKRATANLEQELSNMDQQVERLDKEARTYVRAGNKTKAKACLRQKLQVLKRMKEKETAFDNLTGIMNQLAQTKEQKAIFDAYQAGVSAFKNNLAKHGLSPENVDKTMDDIQEALSDHEDIRSAIAQGPVGFGGPLDASQEELEQELNDILQDEARAKQKMPDKRTIRLPDIPVYDEEEEEQEDRLKRLRRALEAS